MLIPKNSGRLAALVAALTLTACGGSPGGGSGGASCDYDQLHKGCVGLLNFYGTSPQQIGGVMVPAPTLAANGHKEAGIVTKMVPNTAVSSANAFQAVVNGATLSVSCTVTANSWVDVNPGVVLQPSGNLLSCINW